LLRHPEYWVYAVAPPSKLACSAEAQFNRLGLASGAISQKRRHVNNQLKAATPKGALPAAQKGGELDNPTRLTPEGPGEYIIVTLLAATLGNLQLPAINNADERQALRQIGGILAKDCLRSRFCGRHKQKATR